MSDPNVAFPGGGGRGRVLLADDEEPLLLAMSRFLARAGFDVDCAPDGREAVALLERTAFDVVVSDIAMPGLDGIALLRVVRERDLDVPVILATGAPQLESAMQAVALGAFDYLVKPVELTKLEQVVSRAHVLHRLARVKRHALDFISLGGLGLAERAGLEACFDRALASMWMAYQPIITAREHTLFGYEALMRTEERTLPNPLALLDAAERLERLADLGRHGRALAPSPMLGADPQALLFVNLHAFDLRDATLLSPDVPLTSMARRVVLEVTERTCLDRASDVGARARELRELGFRFAVDDLGSGYAGLTNFLLLEPDFVKLDGALVRGVDASATKQKLVQAVVTLCHDLGMRTVAESVETVAERDTLVALGCDLLQGFLFARPGRAFPAFDWGPVT